MSISCGLFVGMHFNELFSVEEEGEYEEEVPQEEE